MSDFFRNTLEIKAMARHPEFAYRNTPRGWEVNNPASLSASGKRERHFFRTRDEAKEHAARLREKAQAHGKNAIAIKPSLAEDATKAAEELKPWGASLLEAARFFAAARERDRVAASRTRRRGGRRRGGRSVNHRDRIAIHEPGVTNR